MSDRLVHCSVGVVAGGSTACALAQRRPPPQVIFEAIGGVLGGFAGARLPDLLDPPLHPGHRSLAHGLMPVGLAGRATARSLPGWQEQLRSTADRHALKARVAPTPVERLWHELIAMLCRIAAGALAGLIAGYGSHVLLDAFTPAGIPLLA